MVCFQRLGSPKTCLSTHFGTLGDDNKVTLEMGQTKAGIYTLLTMKGTLARGRLQRFESWMKDVFQESMLTAADLFPHGTHSPEMGNSIEAVVATVVPTTSGTFLEKPNLQVSSGSVLKDRERGTPTAFIAFETPRKTALVVNLKVPWNTDLKLLKEKRNGPRLKELPQSHSRAFDQH
ncbi:hypothetical protein ASPZODRAFT_899169 [Penicilliopsis zonata CBS 506.65]|uniref:Uncharacterized protein n=1 Tax=Penicilliopsis zonata CBS 506.65 TaxID=1073090 RepID=A0A1L9S8X9_9EURO|nr:hypothetical protein ASPZODRAFT_899169 [Penicilliopsis zonata CBS 506.65]OJJ43617.1 hypothetical protein ASPZODRAFT_899169 [Penicilliopsis zonata CBS 506.65]